MPLRKIRMLEKKYSVSAETYELIKKYAASRNQSVSSFIVFAAVAEMSKHPRRATLHEVVESIVEDYLKDRFPT